MTGSEEVTKIDADADAVADEFSEWCDENDMDTDDPSAWELFVEDSDYQSDPYTYNGLSRSDFL